MTGRQRLYGLVVEADFDLHQDRPADGEPVDVRVRRGDTVSASEDVAPGDPVLDWNVEGQRWYSCGRSSDGDYLLRFNGACEFHISADLSDVVVSEVEGAMTGISEVLTTGAMLALQLYLRGHSVLHASAVELDGSALAFLGSSGQGKSTMAALQCADGAALITDDVLRVDIEDTVPRCHLGATELRLRTGPSASVLSSNASSSRSSVDGRHCVRPPDSARDLTRLDAAVIPLPDKDGGDLHIERIPPAEALFAVLNLGRLYGWADTAVVENHFQLVSQFVQVTPVYVARVPWGPPFFDVAARIRHEVLRS